MAGVNVTAVRAAARRQYERQYLTQSATVLRATKTRDEQGGTSNTTAEIGPIACRVITHRSTGEQVAGEEVLSVEQWEIRFPIGTTLLPTDTIRVSTGEDSFDSYEVATIDATLPDALYRAVRCVRLQ